MCYTFRLKEPYCGRAIQITIARKSSLETGFLHCAVPRELFA